MKTHALFFPFDLFGHAGARLGTELLADAFQELLRDNRREKVPTRSRAYAGKVRFEEFLFENLADYTAWRSTAQEVIAPVLQRGDFLVWTTGNHLGVLPLYDVLAKLPKRTLVIQFDAHLDIYHLSDCTKELSHGNFLRHCEGALPAIINLGHRELLLRSEDIRRFYQHAFSAAELHRDSSPALEAIRLASEEADLIVIDLDCDVYDPAYFPGVAQPEPFGLSPAFILSCLQKFWSDRLRVLAISEFVPAHDRRDQSLATLLWLLEWVLLRTHERQ